ncbi:MAG: WD40 repeat domain-containing protein [Anaerolineales bacterium]|nr:WD40 repeat domain-containing protein [Anaerolineales bacterium]
MIVRSLFNRIGLILIVLILGLASSGWWAITYIEAVSVKQDSAQIPPLSAATISAANVQQIKPLARWGQGHTHKAIYAPDGRWLAVATSLGIFFYEPQSVTASKFIETEAQVWDSAFSPDGKLLAVALANNTVQLRQASTGAVIKILADHTSIIKRVSFSPDGTLLAAASANDITLWRIADGKILRTLTGSSGALLNHVAFSPDGKLLAAGAYSEDSVHLWQISTGEELPSLQEQSLLDKRYGAALSLAFSPDGAVLASGTSSGMVRLWQVSTGTLLRKLENGTGIVNNVTFSPDGTSLASAADDGIVRLWRIADGKLLYTLPSPEPVRSVTFSPDGDSLVAVLEKGNIQTWRVADGFLGQTLTAHSMSAVNSLTFSPGGTRLVSGLADGKISQWQVSDGAALGVIEGNKSAVDTVAFSPDGQYLASGVAKLLAPGLWDDTVHIWPLDKCPGSLGECDLPVYAIKGPRVDVVDCAAFHNSLAFSPDGTIVATGSHDDRVRLWRVAECAKFPETCESPWLILEGHTGTLLDIDFSPEGDLLASASEDGTAKIWQAADGSVLHTFSGHLGAATSVAFSPDGVWLASGAANGMVRLWRVNDGELIYPWRLTPMVSPR